MMFVTFDDSMMANTPSRFTEAWVFRLARNALTSPCDFHSSMNLKSDATCIVIIISQSNRKKLFGVPSELSSILSCNLKHALEVVNQGCQELGHK